METKKNEDCNTGDFNTGNRNAGDCNTGDFNTGNRNTGDFNTGNRNTGDFNTGYFNAGYCNTGDFNTGNRNTGYFNTTEPTVRMFNQDTGLKFSEINLPRFNMKITEWVESDKMTEEEKQKNISHLNAGGFLKKRTYKEAFKIEWDVNERFRKAVLNLPKFDAEIFEEITGIDLRK
jgi:hypothetical protein